MRYLLFPIFILSCFLTHAQEDRIHCAKRTAFTHSQLKSPNLNLQQIAKSKLYDVHFYALDLTMDNLSTEIDGTVKIHGKVKENLDTVILELYSGLNISDVRIDGTSSVFVHDVSLLKIPVNLNTGDQFVIAIDYAGTPPFTSQVQFGGSGMSNATSAGGHKVTWSLSEPFSAYEWFPCKQDLRDKADSVSVKITVPNTCKAGSNGLLENVVDLGDGTSRYEWFHRHPIAYYLISVAVAEYYEYNIFANPVGSVNPVLIQNYIYDNPSSFPSYLGEIDLTVDMMELFAELFGPYPFDDEKYGHCLAPLEGGMEHQTMTTQGNFNKGLTAHELGHQWWGNNVTCASWSDIWVNEGFASYAAYLMLENLFPTEAATEMEDIHTDVMAIPYGSIWVTDSLSEYSIFNGRLTYDKGAAFVHTLRFIMNDDSLFFLALRNFQDEFKDSVAVGLDIKNHLEAVSSIDFDDAFDQWYFGEGYPKYSLRWNSIGEDLYFNISHWNLGDTPTFTNPLEIKFERLNLPDTTIRVDIVGNNDYVVIPDFGATGTTAEIDPNNWIINEVGTVLYDPNYTSVQKQESTVKLNVFPNPTSDQFNIIMDDHTDKSVQVLTSHGKVVFETKFNAKTSVNLDSVDAGYYIVKITSTDGRQWVKTIVVN
ncbi:M1 family aminopeptidase [Brumimicrobium sp.]|uniref:M1 family aminopeptidase n=1 Tax=Brumimicrobium sp. TaxID=2029867 RepID=UPI003A94DE84